MFFVVSVIVLIHTFGVTVKLEASGLANISLFSLCRRPSQHRRSFNVFGFSFIESMPGGYGAPENITVTFLNPTTVRVSWATALNHVDKYDITYKPTDASYRVVEIVAGNSDAVTLSNLHPDTQYQLTISAVWSGRKYRSRPIVFRTLEPPRSSAQQDSMAVAAGVSATTLTTTSDYTTPKSSTTEKYNIVEYPQTSSTVRGVEIGIVLIVLVVWIAAIALFFNRWGKIRMLLPYQPDYKQEQLKVPGTAACAAAVATGNLCAHHATSNICQQVHAQPPRTPRPRMNSAIFVSNSGPGIDPKEFFRRYGSVSRLCRKARSVDNISLEEQHFGLPTLSISGPSPSENEEETEIRETDHCLA